MLFEDRHGGMFSEPDCCPKSRELKGIDDGTETEPPGMSSRQWDKKKYKRQKKTARLTHFKAQSAKERMEAAIAGGLDPNIVEKIDVEGGLGLLRTAARLS
jgi:hypothetical protein